MNDPSRPAAPVIIIGAGPVGLAAAAELALRQIPFLMLEAGQEVGSHMQAWGHVRMFSPWRYDTSAAARALLAPTGWHLPDPDHLPTGQDIVDLYLRPLADVPAIRPALRFSTRVVAVTRLGLDKVKSPGRADRLFLVRVLSKGKESDIPARAVIDCSGSLAIPNPGGAHGIPARGEVRNADRITYGMPDVPGRARARYAGRRVAVLGSGHSAIGTILDLVALKDEEPLTRILWLTRRADFRLAFGGGDSDALPARGALGSRLRDALENHEVETIRGFVLDEIIRRADGGLDLVTVWPATPDSAVVADELIVATGFRPDLSFLSEVRLMLDPALECPAVLAPLIDPNLHSCGTVRPHGAAELGHPDPGFYLAGMKSYGRAPTFLLATGYEQVRSIVAEIAGDHVAAARVELDLPQTGVCASDISIAAPAPASSCCGGTAKSDATACCVKDEVEKASGNSGCGCASEPRPVSSKASCC